MSQVNLRPTDSTAMLASVDPASQGAGTVTSAWFSVQNFHAFLLMVSTGVLGAAATIDAKIQQATDSSGTGAKDVTGKAITQIVKATGDNVQALVNFRAQDMDTEGGFNNVRISLTVGAAASQVAAYLMGFHARFQPPVDSVANPAVQFGSTTVKEIK